MENYILWWVNLTPEEKTHVFNMYCDETHKDILPNPESVGNVVVSYMYDKHMMYYHLT